MTIASLYPETPGTFVDLGDGKRGYVAAPSGPGPHPGVVVIQDAFGVGAYIQSEVRRLAAASFAAVAPDLFDGRTLEYDDKSAEAEALKTQPDAVMLDHLRAASAYLDRRADVARAPYGVVGFCMGGRLAFLAAAEFGASVRAAVAFYGGGIAPDGPARRPSIVDRATDVVAPLLLLYGADDASIPPSEHGRLATALSAAKKDYTLRVFPDAGHGFATRARASFRSETAERAWAQAVAFLRR